MGFFLQEEQLCCIFCNSQANGLNEPKELENEVVRLKNELQEAGILVTTGKTVKATNINQEESSIDDTTCTNYRFQTVKNSRQRHYDIKK